jgi:hypothetical protein
MSGDYWVCEKCGTKNSVEDTYCRKCGRKITRKELADALNRISGGTSTLRQTQNRPQTKRVHPQWAQTATRQRSQPRAQIRENVRSSSSKHQIFDDDSTFVVPLDAVKQRETLQKENVRKASNNEAGARERVRQENLERQRAQALRENRNANANANEEIQEKRGIFVPESHKQSKVVKYVPRLIYLLSFLTMGACLVVYLVSGTKLGTRVTFWEFLSTLGGNFSELFQVIYGNIIKMFGGL